MIRSDGTCVTVPQQVHDRTPCATLAMMRRWWLVRGDFAGRFTTPDERLRATDLLRAFLA